MTAQEMWDRSGLKGNYQAWAFGGAPDKLAGLVLQGVKNIQQEFNTKMELICEEFEVVFAETA